VSACIKAPQDVFNAYHFSLELAHPLERQQPRRVPCLLVVGENRIEATAVCMPMEA
jgi:hypothetical protein